MIRPRRQLIVFALLGLLFACAPARLPAERVKLLVSKQGMYRVTSDALRAIGVPTDQIDPATLQLFRGDREVAIRVQGQDKGFTLDFYGQASDSPYSALNVYRLRWGVEKGRRISTVSIPLPLSTPNETFQDILLVKHPTVYFPQAGASDTSWFWQSLTAPMTWTYTLTLPSAIPAAARLQVNLWGVTADPASPDHHVQVFMNETPIADETFDGQGAQALAGDVPASAVGSGDNALRLVAPGDTNAAADVTLLSSVVVTYTRQFSAEKDVQSFQAARTTVRVGGLGKDEVDVFDITDPENPIHAATHPTTAPPADGAVVFVSNAESPHRWLAVGAAGYQSVAAITPMAVRDVRLETRQADYVIISHPDFVDALRPLVEQRTRAGHRVAVVTTDEIYDEFNFGNESPVALRAFLDSLRPAPRFVLLVGKASYDYWDYVQGPNKNLVPTFLVDTPNLRQAGSDNWFAESSTFDIRPAFAIGRIPAKTRAQVALAIDKIISYESKAGNADWRQHALFVADDKEPTFAEMADVLSDKLPAEIDRDKVYLGAHNADILATRADMIARWNAGTLLLTYIGHGSLDTWAEGPLFGSEYLGDIHNADRLPILVTPTCLDGFFYHPQRDSLAEELLFKQDGGIIAGIVPTGLSFPNAQRQLMEALFAELFQNQATTLGEAVQKAKQRIDASSPENREVIETFGILGDPGLEIRQTQRGSSK